MYKIVLITGATSGIGLACARKFAENGDRLILTGRNEKRLDDIKKELNKKGTQIREGHAQLFLGKILRKQTSN